MKQTNQTENSYSKVEEMDLPEVKLTKVSNYSVECPYCKKMLASQYVAQLNQHYKSHTDNCKKNPSNIPVSEGGSKR